MFGDSFEVTILDPDHSAGEHRFPSIGLSEHRRLLVVSYAESADNRIRIISARNKLRTGSAEVMSQNDVDTMREEYDFSEGVHEASTTKRTAGVQMSSYLSRTWQRYSGTLPP